MGIDDVYFIPGMWENVLSVSAMKTKVVKVSRVESGRPVLLNEKGQLVAILHENDSGKKTTKGYVAGFQGVVVH